MINGQAYLFLLPLMIFLSALLSVSNGDFHIDQNESTTIISPIDGDAITLKCPLPHHHGMQYAWTHNDAFISYNHRVQQIGDDLHVKKLNKLTDNGLYNCVASSITRPGYQRQISSTFKLEIVWLKSVQVMYRSSSKKHRTNIVLACNVNGNHIQQIRWFKNDIELQPLVDRVEFEAHKLILKNPDRDTDGSYRCSARNQVGSIRSDLYRLEVDNDIAEEDANRRHNSFKCTHHPHKKVSSEVVDHSKKVSTTLLCRGKRSGFVAKRNADELPADALKQGVRRQLSVHENRQAVLNCDLKHVDKNGDNVLVKWKRDGKLIRQVKLNGPASDLADTNIMENPMLRDEHISLNNKNGSLIIPATVPADAGAYDCFVYKNSDSPIAMQSTELTIIEELRFSPKPTSKQLEMGSIGKLHCKVQGTPTPQVRWINDGSDRLPDLVEDINGTLVFRNVSENDRGNYTCIANSTQGTITATVLISTVIAPKFIVKPSGPIQVNEMSPAWIHCKAIGDPKPTIQWDKDLVPMNINNSETTDRITILENGTIHLTEVHVDDEGVYGCTIGSLAGFKREEAKLIVRPTDEFLTEEGQEDSFFIARAVLITISVVLAYIILVVGLMLWCRLKRQARKNHMQLIAKENMDTFTGNDTRPNDEHEPCLPDQKKSVRISNGKFGGELIMNGKDGAQKSDDTANSNKSNSSKKSHLDQITLPRAILMDLTQLGRGEFGTVSTAKVKTSDLNQYLHKDTVAILNAANEYEKRRSKSSLDDINEIKEESDENGDDVKYALVKALNKVKDENVCIEFRRQIDMFRAISHRNVVKLFGLCRDKDPHYLVLEHSELGDLKQYLTARNESAHINGVVQNNLVNNGIVANGGTKPDYLKLSQLLNFAQQVARGMDAIYRARYIHKDLAARNCIITADLTVKISYPAIHTDKYSREYYKYRNAVVPLRWMAPECFDEDDSTIKSDVFSYGVLLWELVTRCTQLPFESFTDEDYLTQMQANKLDWKLPNDCSDELKDIMTSCWKTNPKERPSFSNLNTSISRCLQKLQST